MGYGDVKLLGMLGTFFGPGGVLLIIILSSVVGSVIGVTVIQLNKGKETDVGEGNIGHYLPFGPYIVLGALIHLFFGLEIIVQYMRYVGMDTNSIVATMEFLGMNYPL